MAEFLTVPTLSIANRCIASVVNDINTHMPFTYKGQRRKDGHGGSIWSPNTLQLIKESGLPSISHILSITNVLHLTVRVKDGYAVSNCNNPADMDLSEKRARDGLDVTVGSRFLMNDMAVKIQNRCIKRLSSGKTDADRVHSLRWIIKMISEEILSEMVIYCRDDTTRKIDTRDYTGIIWNILVILHYEKLVRFVMGKSKNKRMIYVRAYKVDQEPQEVFDDWSLLRTYKLLSKNQIRDRKIRDHSLF